MFPQLINGDVSSGFKHKGFKQIQKVKQIRSSPCDVTQTDGWLKDIKDVLNQVI